MIVIRYMIRVQESSILTLAKLELTRNATVGTYGSSIMATVVSTRDPVFVKFIPFGFCVRPTSVLTSRFNSIRRRLIHPGLVPLRALILPEDGNPQSVGIVSQYCPGGSLFDLLHRSNSSSNWTPTQKTITILGLAFALDFLHSNGMIHSFLTASNIVFTSSMEPQVADYWVSSLVLSDAGIARGPKPTISMAPELFDPFEHSDKVDVYAFGIILYHIVTGIEPIRVELTPIFARGAPKAFMELHRKCCDPRPTARPSFKQIVEVLMKDDLYTIPEADLGEVAAFKQRMISLQTAG
jgi:serine/threonine protein kinase